MRKLDHRYVGLILIIVDLILLFLGLSLPCIEVRGKLFGLIPLGTETKSIVGIILNLFESNVFLAVLLVTFSVIIPILKLSFTVFLLISKKNSSNNFLLFLVHNIGKWSMVDVFSMSIIVAMLTFDNLRIKIFSTDGTLLMGFYFFLSYGLLSIFTTYFLRQKIKFK